MPVPVPDVIDAPKSTGLDSASPPATQAVTDARPVLYRPNVAAILLNMENYMLVAQRSGLRSAWQFPQGGVDPGEGLEEALFREVEEEIGIIPDPRDLRLLGIRVCANEAQPGIVDREIQDLFLLRDDRPLENFRPNTAELAALVRFPLETLVPFLAGDRSEVNGESIAPGATQVESITARSDDFIPAVDRYFLRIAIAAQHALRGERYVAV